MLTILKHQSVTSVYFFSLILFIFNCCQFLLSRNSFADLIFFVVAEKMAYRGDVIVCLVDFNKVDEESRVPVLFNLNGTLIYEARMKYKEGKTELYPFIGMCHKGIRVLAKVRVISCHMH